MPTETWAWAATRPRVQPRAVRRRRNSSATVRGASAARPPILWAGRLGVDQNCKSNRGWQRPLALLAALACVAVEAALQVQVAPAQVQHLAPPPAGEQVGQDQGAQAQAGRRFDRNRSQEPGHLLGAQPSGPGVGLPPWRPDALAGVVGAQAFGARPAVE